MMMSPYVEVIDRAAKIMFRAADSMGFSPVARPRLKLVKPGDEDTDAKDNPWRSLKLIPGGKAS
jgi:phage terminase small subunit